MKWHEIGQVENAANAGWTRAVSWPLDLEEDRYQGDAEEDARKHTASSYRPSTYIFGTALTAKLLYISQYTGTYPLSMPSISRRIGTSKLVRHLPLPHRYGTGEVLDLLGILVGVHLLAEGSGTSAGRGRRQQGGTPMVKRVPASVRTREPLSDPIEDRLSFADGRAALLKPATRLIVEKPLEARAATPSTATTTSTAHPPQPRLAQRRAHGPPEDGGRVCGLRATADRRS